MTRRSVRLRVDGVTYQGPAVKHSGGEGCDCGGSFRCDVCRQEVGWCMGAYDDVERAFATDQGICDVCAGPLARKMEEVAS